MKKLLYIIGLVLLLSSCGQKNVDETKVDMSASGTENENIIEQDKTKNDDKADLDKDTGVEESVIIPDLSKNKVFTSLDFKEKGSEFRITGRVEDSIDKVEVFWSNGDQEDNYVLKKFKSDDKQWLTNLKSSYNNIGIGENHYTIKGYKGNKLIEEFDFNIILDECIINFNTYEGETYVFNFGKADNCNNGKLNINSEYSPMGYIDKGLDVPEGLKERSEKEFGVGVPIHFLPRYFIETISIDNTHIKVSQSKILHPFDYESLQEENLTIDGIEANSEIFTNHEGSDYIYKLHFGDYDTSKIYIEGEIGNLERDKAEESFVKYNEIFGKTEIYNSPEMTQAIKPNTGSNTSDVELGYVDNNMYSEKKLIADGFQKNNLGEIDEYYKSVILNANNGYFSNRTVYTDGKNTLAFEIIYAQGINLQILYPVKETIFLDEFLNNIEAEQGEYGYSIGQPILGEYDYKVIITDLNTIKVVNKTQNVNEVIWKR